MNDFMDDDINSSSSALPGLKRMRDRDNCGIYVGGGSLDDDIYNYMDNVRTTPKMSRTDPTLPDGMAIETLTAEEFVQEIINKEGRRDFSYVNFTGQNLSKQLEKYVINLADVSGLNFTGANFTKANLSKICFPSGLNCNNANFEQANLTEAKFGGNTDLGKTIFKNAILDRARFGDSCACCLVETNFANAILKNATFNANLDEANLSGANLSGATFDLGVSLIHTNLSGADLTGARFDEWINLRNIMFDEKTIFIDATLSDEQRIQIQSSIERNRQVDVMSR